MDDSFDVEVAQEAEPCSSGLQKQEKVEETPSEVSQESEDMPTLRSSTGSAKVKEEKDETMSTASEDDLFESPRKRRRPSPSPVEETPTRSPRSKRIKVEEIEGLEEEAPDEEDESTCSTPPPSRAVYRRNCVVEAAKIKTSRKVKTEPQAESESREGSCDRSDCPLKKVCCLALENSCISAHTDPKLFYHLSKTEHVCHICYDILWKCNSPRFAQKYSEWKAKWSEESRCHPGVKSFILDQILPYWIECSRCKKFRKHESEKVVTPEFMTKFECGKCSEKEEAVVADARDHSWIYSIVASTLLQNSPSLFYLKGGHYFYDELGLSPVEHHFEAKQCSTTTFMSPFNIPEQQSKAFCLRPDMMDYDEVVAFPEYSVEGVLYLAVRNLIVTLWNINPFDYLTLEECISHLICRGLARVWYIHEMGRIYEFLRYKSIINYGILGIPKQVASQDELPMEVIIVGAGISGLSAARQLRSFGVNVKVLEAKGVIGGRMQDDWSLGVAVGCGAQLVTGSINNPIILMCEQMGVKYRILDGGCPLIDGQEGGPVDWKVDKYVEEHFDCILDALYHWKKSTKHGDASLNDRVTEVHDTLLREGGVAWGDKEERVLQFHLGNIEFSCGAKLNDVSWRHWDQNEAVALFAGSHALLTDGSRDILKHLADGTDVRTHHEVTKIEWGDAKKKATVHCQNGTKYTADKVLVALPLAVLKKKKSIFSPLLPKKKLQAMTKIGAGLIEKVAVRFPRRFWSSVAKNGSEVNYFSLVPKSGEERGLFNMFYDFSTQGPPGKNSHYVLMSYVCGDSVDIVNQLSDAEVAERFVDALRDMFPEEEVPEPDGYVVTHWGKDPHIGMSYSYVRTGGAGEHYDQLAESVAQRVYFAGECTNRFFPQTMTGAYLSGLREAGKMMEDFKN